MSDVGSARRAKEKLKGQIGGEPWCAGVGVDRVSVRPGTTGEARSLVPASLDGVMIKVVENDA